MLGSMVSRVLATDPKLDVTATVRREGTTRNSFDARRDPVEPLLDSDDFEWIVNAIGVVKLHIDERDAGSIENALAVNALFPYRLAAESAKRGQRVIQIATDGVFAGTAAPYDESAAHDAHDVYGKTKSLGEVPAANVVHLRCSIVGPERPPAASLLGWILAAAAGDELTGYTAQRWNGITTLHFARLCAALIAGVEVPALQHVVPADSMTKAEFLEIALAAFGRDGVQVRRVPGPGAADRTLRTSNPEVNRRLWAAAGHGHPPTIREMLADLAELVADSAHAAP
jgi:dTDP-4-dehydrorhamnose reductase